jgi:hypothetical protein
MTPSFSYNETCYIGCAESVRTLATELCIGNAQQLAPYIKGSLSTDDAETSRRMGSQDGDEHQLPCKIWGFHGGEYE